jgi:hypothetical protein
MIGNDEKGEDHRRPEHYQGFSQKIYGTKEPRRLLAPGARDLESSPFTTFWSELLPAGGSECRGALE